jgi:hypothetical protein
MVVARAIYGDKISVFVQLRKLKGKRGKTNMTVLNHSKIPQNVTRPAGHGNYIYLTR